MQVIVYLRERINGRWVRVDRRQMDYGEARAGKLSRSRYIRTHPRASYRALFRTEFGRLAE